MAGECGHHVTQCLHVELSRAFLHVVITLGVEELGQFLVFLNTVGEQCSSGGVHKRVAGFVLFLKLGEDSSSQYLVPCNTFYKYSKTLSYRKRL